MYTIATFIFYNHESINFLCFYFQTIFSAYIGSPVTTLLACSAIFVILVLISAIAALLLHPIKHLLNVW